MAIHSIDSCAYQRALRVRDLTDAAYGPHALQLLVSDVIGALTDRWNCSAIVYRAPPVVSVADNYDRLHYPADGAARDARYTRYVSGNQLLRTQTSALVPNALAMIAPAHYDDVVLACPGLTYRRDSIDRWHVGEPHQLDLWRLRRQPLDREDLVQMIHAVAGTLLPGAALQLREAKHPYTREGLEVYASVRGTWIEILECGLALPALLEECGCAGLSGLAMGMGLDRVLMLRKGIDDIRLLRSEDPRIATQMLDLQPYRSVSTQPAIARDLSLAVQASLSAEEIGDRVRSALDARAAASIEEIRVLSETSYEDLAGVARQRLGMRPEHKNVLVRLVIRDLERTLTSHEANELRDTIYALVHEGDVKVWAARNHES